MTLLELAAKVKAAEGPDRRLDAEIALAVGWLLGLRSDYADDSVAHETWTSPDYQIERYTPPAYTSSVDAAMMLVPEGWFWRVGRSTLYAGWAHLNRKHPDFCNREDEHSAQAATPALALTAASLRARSENPA